MLVEFTLFWLFFLCVSELLITRHAAYGVSMLFTLIISLVVFLFYYDFDLFGSILLVLYSSVFLLLSMFILYFNRYWGKSNSASYVESALLDVGIICALICAPTLYVTYESPLYINNALVNAATVWYFRFVGYDFVASLHNAEALTVSLMHSVLYKVYVLESFFLNVYLFIGLVLSVGLLLLFKL